MKELADAKAENDVSAWWCCRWSSSVAHQCQFVSQCVSHHASGVIMQPPPDWQTPLNGLFHPQRGWSLCKNNWKEPRSILMSRVDRASTRWATHAIIVYNTHALPAEYKCLVIKLSNPFTNVCWVSVLTIFSAPPQILAASTVSSAQFQKRRNDGWWFFLWCYFSLPVCFVVNACWAHPAISRASAVASSIFSWCYSLMLFEVRRIVCVEN